MTGIQFLWLAALIILLVLVNAWKAEGALQSSIRQAAIWMIGTGIVLWAVLLFRTLGAFGRVQLP